MSNNNRRGIPQARETMDQFKMQVSRKISVNLTNGRLTTRESCDLGKDQRIRRFAPYNLQDSTRNSINSLERTKSILYIAFLTV